MCYHITATLPQGTKLDAIQQIIDRYDMAFAPLENAHVKAQLNPGALYFLTTKGHCDCDTVLGYASTGQLRESILQSKKYQTLKKKRWSEAKLNAWIEEKIKKESEKKSKHRRTYSPIELEKRTSRWINFIRNMLQSGSISHIGLLKHWYKGSLETEEISLKDKQKVRINELDTHYLTHLEDDILYCIIF